MARQKGDKWIADFIDTDGQRKRIQCKTKQEAEQLEAQPALAAARAQDPTVSEFNTWAIKLWGGTLDERSSLCITNQLVNDLGPLKKVKSISSADIDALRKKWEARGNAKRTMNTKLAKLSKLLNYAVDELRIMPDRPKTTFNKVRKGRIRSLSSNEEGAILAGLKPEFRMLAQFLLYTGCRVSEARKLTWKDVDFANGSVTFWDTKNGDERSVPLHPKAEQAVRHSQGRASPFGHIAYDTFIKAWRRAKASAGLGDDRQVVPHVLRHTCATRLGKGKMDPLRLQQWMGHSSLEMTKRYTHLNVDDLRTGTDLL